jgi:hypothetical protein
MKVKEVHAGRLYRIGRTEINGIGFVNGGGHLWVAEESGPLMYGNIYIRTPLPFRSVATGVVLKMAAILLDSLDLEEADGGDT